MDNFEKISLIFFASAILLLAVGLVYAVKLDSRRLDIMQQEVEIKKSAVKQGIQLDLNLNNVSQGETK